MIKKQKNVNKAEQSEFGLFCFKENSIKKFKEEENTYYLQEINFFY